MKNIGRVAVLALVLAAVSFTTGGCAYMKNRGNDALDIFDIGVTFTKEPHVGVYAGFQSLLSVGYVDIEDGYMFGIGQRHAGWLPMRYKAGGALLEGREGWGFDGNYDKANPESPLTRGVGLGLIYHETPRTVPQFFQCPKFVHVGWIGVNVNCKLGALAQFLAGWFGADMGHSDGTHSDRAVSTPIMKEDGSPAAAASTP